jgi:hypothetical protein
MGRFSAQGTARFVDDRSQDPAREKSYRLPARGAEAGSRFEQRSSDDDLLQTP